MQIKKILTEIEPVHLLILEEYSNLEHWVHLNLQVFQWL